ncbi:MAG: GGDEF domain-containing protein [Candidatus Sabulitectum sp.]|nr:GGDEF domain-containing protein [Candidatus Sabulitectum sp.]
MKYLQYKRPSTYLIVLSFVILGLGFVMAFYVHNTVENLKFDAKIINETGIIRGSIQRATKLVLSNSQNLSNETIWEINSLFDHFIAENDRSRHPGVEETVFLGLLDLREKWFSLEGLLIEYRVNPSEQVRSGILLESEHCWEAADSVVLAAQYTTEGKVGNFTVFYRILAINAITAILVILYVIVYVRKKLEYESSHDALTGLFNRRSYEKMIQSEIARCTRYSSKLSLIVFDVDKFKLINDHNGHGAGDRVLADIAEAVKDSIRVTDVVFRVGGDEFAVISPETDADGAFQLAEKIRKRIEQHSFATGNTETVSLGIAEFKKGITKKVLYRHADTALYIAKSNGRNRSETWVK